MNNFYTLFFFILWSLQVSYQLSATGEKVPFSLIFRMLPSSPTVLEAGAQFGEDSRWMSEAWRGGMIHAFEPNPESYPELCKTAKSTNNIITYPFALSDKEGQCAFYLAGGASSLLCPTESFNDDYFHCDLNHPVMVEVTTIDQWAKENGIKEIDFMWLDMEGNELNALQGATEMLPKIKLIYTEINFQRFWKGCVQYEELKHWLETRGFNEIWIDYTPHWHGNALFINNNLL